MNAAAHLTRAAEMLYKAGVYQMHVHLTYLSLCSYCSAWLKITVQEQLAEILLHVEGFDLPAGIRPGARALELE